MAWKSAASSVSIVVGYEKDWVKLRVGNEVHHVLDRGFDCVCSLDRHTTCYADQLATPLSRRRCS